MLHEGIFILLANLKCNAMKKLFKTNVCAGFLSLFFVLMSMVIFAQEKVVTTTTHKETRSWWVEPWVWVVGAVVLVIVLAAIFGGRNKTIITDKRTRTIE